MRETRLYFDIMAECSWCILIVRRRRAGHFWYFLIFAIIKNYFLHFYQVNLTGGGLFKLDCSRNRLLTR